MADWSSWSASAPLTTTPGEWSSWSAAYAFTVGDEAPTVPAPAPTTGRRRLAARLLTRILR